MVSGPTPTPSPGMVLNRRYELQAHLASGGMAQVWRALDVVLDRLVAVKILHPHMTTDADFVVRFQREARAAARLSHPSIVAIYDTVSEPGLEAIVMELIEGRTLRSVLDQAGALAPASVVHIAIQVSAALAEAHRAGLVHRDIKPANIMIASDDRVLVTDFGIAKADTDTDLTHAGSMVGTAKYLSPEQVNGEGIDARSDIYSTGVVMFECLTGRAPFEAETDMGTALARLRQEPPRCTQFRPDVPPALDDVVLTTMAIDKTRRYAHAVDLQTALAAVNPAWDTRTVNQTPGQAVNQTQTPGQAVSQAGPPPPPGGPPLTPDGTAVMVPADEVEAPPKRKRRWLQRLAMAVIVPAALVVAGALLVNSINGAPTVDDEAGDFNPQAGFPLAQAVPIDPLGDGKERHDLAAAAIDDDVTTRWQTETYKSSPLGGLKAGVGLVLVLGEDQDLNRLSLLTDSTGWSARVYLLDDGFDPAELGTDPGFTPGSVGQQVAEVTDGSIRQTITIDGVGSQLLVWITDTGVTSDESTGTAIRFELFEVTVS